MKAKLHLMKYLWTFVASAAMVGFSGCGNDDDPVIPAILTVDRSEIEFQADNNEDMTVLVTAVAEWTHKVSEEAGWIICTRESNKLLVNVQSNDGASRTGTITVTCGGETATITVKQKGLNGKVTLAFESAVGKYLGVSECGYTSKYSITFTKGSRTLTMIAYDDLFAIPSRFNPSPGSYTLDDTYERLTFIGSDEDKGVITGSVYSGGYSNISIDKGSFELAFNETAAAYTFTAALEGEDISDFLPYEMEFTFTGQIEFTSDVVLEYADYGADVFVKYYGDYQTNDGIARYDVRFTGDFYDGQQRYDGFQIRHLFAAEPAKDPENAPIPSGIYRVRAEKDKFTIMPGYLNPENGYIGGAYNFTSPVSSSNPERAILAEHGTLIVNNMGTKYEIYGHFAGKNLKSGEIENFAFKQEGDFPIANMVPASLITLNSAEYTAIKRITAGYYGDEYGTGGSSFKLHVSLYKPDLTGYVIWIDLCAPAVENFRDLPEGVYSIREGNGDFTCTPAVREAGIKGSQLHRMAPSGGIDRLWMFNEGEITVAKEGTGFIITGNIIAMDAASAGGDITEVKLTIDRTTISFTDMTK